MQRSLHLRVCVFHALWTARDGVKFFSSLMAQSVFLVVSPFRTPVCIEVSGVAAEAVVALFVPYSLSS